MGGAIVSFAALPWLDKSPIRSCRYRPVWKWCVWLFVIDFFVLMVVERCQQSNLIIISQFGTVYWFAFLFLLAPIVGKFESPKNLPLYT